MNDLPAVALVPAWNEADRIAATVRSLRELRQVGNVVVVDDGSSDATASVARDAGASVLRASRRTGKGGALEGALRRLPQPEVWLLADADLAASASGLGSVLAEVIGGRADLAIAVIPKAAGGGFGIVKSLAAGAIRLACGFRATQPLSGQRAITAEGMRRCRPLAGGFGVETAMTIDAVRAGLRVIEVESTLSHRPTGRRLRGFAHRGHQGLDIARAVVPRLIGMR
jgi:glycosyl transferase family 2